MYLLLKLQQSNASKDNSSKTGEETYTEVNVKSNVPVASEEESAVMVGETIVETDDNLKEIDTTLCDTIDLSDAVMVEKQSTETRDSQKLKEDSVNTEGEDIAEKNIEDNSGKSKVETILNPPPEFVQIHATAIFENSPFNVLTQDEYESLGRFVTSLNHLEKNIGKVIIDHYSTSIGDGGGNFVHTAQVRILVRVTNLWETPRSYLWRHLGQNTWERGNGTRILLTKIHQKF